MILFTIYAGVLWYCVFRGRRRLSGVAALVVGLFFLIIIRDVHGQVARAFDYEHLLPIFRMLLYPYMGLLALVGVYLFLLPEELPRGELHCKLCRYDLSDLAEEIRSGSPCPECGATMEEASTARGRRNARHRLRAEAKRVPDVVPGLRLE